MIFDTVDKSENVTAYPKDRNKQTYDAYVLSVGWIRHGIEPNRGRAGCPQDNGAHERMHKDMFCEYLLGIIDEEAETFTPRLEKGCKQRIIYARRKQKAYI